MAQAQDLAAALVRLDEITRRLRRDCPWDREQDERSIVPHTVEEAYELADAAHSGDDAKLLDELGDVLFQVYFLSLLLEERGAGSLAAVADARAREADPPPPARVRRSRGRDGRRRACATGTRSSASDERGGEIFGAIPENLPSTLYAKKVLKRARSAGFRWDAEADEDPGERAAGGRAPRPSTRASTPSWPCARRPTDSKTRWTAA